MHDRVLVNETFIREANAVAAGALQEDFDHLARQLARRGVDAEALVQQAMAFRVANMQRHARRWASRATSSRSSKTAKWCSG
jgi:L-rhamnose isomerase